MNGVFIDSNIFLKILEGDEEIRRHFFALGQKKPLYRNARCPFLTVRRLALE